MTRPASMMMYMTKSISHVLFIIMFNRLGSTWQLYCDQGLCSLTGIPASDLIYMPVHVQSFQL